MHQFECTSNVSRIIVSLTTYYVKHETVRKHVFLGLTRFLSFSPFQRCMVRSMNDNSVRRLSKTDGNILLTFNLSANALSLLE